MSDTRQLTAEEFERQYAARAGMTVEQMRKFRTVLPCRCDSELCEGWQSVSYEAAADPFTKMQAGLEPISADSC